MSFVRSGACLIQKLKQFVGHWFDLFVPPFPRPEAVERDGEVVDAGE
jgi:hypothetical protein